jgi:hypothetical protein
MNLTPKQNILVRQFYSDIIGNDSLFTGDLQRYRGYAARLCTDLLGYVLVDGKFIYLSDVKPTTYGQKNVYEDRWESDYKDVLEAANETDSNTDTDEADNSVEAESAEVREAVLPEDV